MSAPTTSTPGVYQREKRSIKRSVGAFDSCASSTRRTTRAMVLSAAAAVTFTRRAASVLMVPANTGSSGFLRLGVLSPVTGASSTALSPETTSRQRGCGRRGAPG